MDVFVFSLNTRTSISNSLLFKDIFSLTGIRRSDKLERLVQYLAYNIGSLISYDAVAREVGISKNTVADYITLLEQCFIVKVCSSFSKNLSNELKKSKKVYFYDNGIRNAIINDFSPISSRSDAGALWENFVFAERLKAHSQRNDFAKIYFWRTSENRPHELDFVEVTDGKMMAIECKMSSEKKGFAEIEGNFPTHSPTKTRFLGNFHECAQGEREISTDLLILTGY